MLTNRSRSVVVQATFVNIQTSENFSKSNPLVHYMDLEEAPCFQVSELTDFLEPQNVWVGSHFSKISRDNWSPCRHNLPSWISVQNSNRWGPDGRYVTRLIKQVVDCAQRPAARWERWCPVVFQWKWPIFFHILTYLSGPIQGFLAFKIPGRNQNHNQFFKKAD